MEVILNELQKNGVDIDMRTLSHHDYLTLVYLIHASEDTTRRAVRLVAAL